MSLTQIEKHDQFDINLSEILARLLENRLIVAIVFLCSFLIATYFSYREIKLYESDLLIQVDSHHNFNQDVFSKLSGVGPGQDPTMSQIFLMQSRYILEPVIETLGLNIHTHYQPNSWWKRYFIKTNYHLGIQKFEIPRHLFKKKFFVKIDGPQHFRLFDEDHREILSGALNKELRDKYGLLILKVGKFEAPIGSEFVLTKQSSLSMIKPLARHFKITQLGFVGNQGTGILQCSFRGQNISETMKILNTIAKIAEKKDIQKRSEEASKTLVFLNKQLPITKRQLEDAEYKLNQYRSKSGKIDIKMQSQMLLQKLVSLDMKLEKLLLKRIQISQKYTALHPAYQRLLRQIDVIHQQKQMVEMQLKNEPAQDQIAINLLRDVSVKKMLYMVFLSKIQEMEVVQAGTLSSVHILTTASRPEAPIPGKSKMYYLYASIFASILSLFYVILRGVMHPRIEDPQWVEKHYLVPNLAIIPYSKEQIESNKHQKLLKNKSLMLLSESHPKHLTVEALRSLRTNMQVNLATSHNNIIGILGISPGVGKSFVSVNIAYLLAVTGKKVLLIDADLRKGTVHKYLNLEPHHGLSECLNEMISVDEAIRKNVHFNLDVMVRGEYPTDPSELLMKNHFKDLINQMSARYDIVVFDTAPVLMVTDGLIVGGLAANNYLVLGANLHEPQDVDLVMNRLKTLGVELKGSIFNFQQASSIINGTYGKYSRYGGYYRNYKAYYADENV